MIYSSLVGGWYAAGGPCGSWHADQAQSSAPGPVTIQSEYPAPGHCGAASLGGLGAIGHGVSPLAVLAGPGAVPAAPGAPGATPGAAPGAVVEVAETTGTHYQEHSIGVTLSLRTIQLAYIEPAGAIL